MALDPQKIKILLVEDAAVMRNIETKTLNKLGFTNIVEAQDGNAAVKILQESDDIDIVISDWNMPNMDGFKLLEWIRSSEKYQALPFIMATGQGDKKQQQKASEAGVSSFIAKPFDSTELQDKIDKAFGLEKITDHILENLKGPQKSTSGKVKLRVAHIQITDHLVLGVLKHLIDRGEIMPKYFELETQCMPSWNPVADALERGRVDAACILAPIAMDLFSFKVPIRLIMLAHKNGSIFVRNKTGEYKDPFQNFFRKKFFLIPHKLSIHHMLSHMFFEKIGLKAGMQGAEGADINFEVVAPIKMPEFLNKHSDSSGFMVAEPIGTKAIASNIAELQFLSGELWEQHPCCVVAMRDDFIGPYTDAVYEFSELLVKSGKFIQTKPEKAAEIAVDFLDPTRQLGLKIPLLKNVLTENHGIKSGDLYPQIDDFEIIQRYMFHEMGIGSLIDLEKFIDTRFADAACGETIGRYRPPNLNETAHVVQTILRRGGEESKTSSKTMLNKEGKYLTFKLGEQEYGIDIYKIKEIIGILPIRTLPNALPFVKGVVNLRDKVIPVIDLRLKFGMEEIAYTDRTCIIVLELRSNGTPVYMGIAVDTVLEVLSIKAGEIEETPSYGLSVDINYILAMAKMEKGLKLLLDIETVLGM
jgi:chemotaxis signal transduction protein/CheY-like chemotaxis protein